MPDSLSRRSTAGRLLDCFRDGEALTRAEIANRLDVSKRHAKRLIETIRDEGVAVEERRRGRAKEYMVPPGEQKGPTVSVDLTEREAMALVLASKASESALSATPLIDPLTAAFGQLVGEMPSSVATFEPEAVTDHLHFFEASSASIAPGVLQTLFRAISGHRKVYVDYYTASRDSWTEGRPISPWTIAVRGDTWLCVGHCHKREATRDFNLARMKNPCLADKSERPVRPGEDFDAEVYFTGRFESLAGDAPRFVKLHVREDCAQYFLDKEYHPTQQAERLEDGSALVTYDVAGLDEIASFVRSWGPKVKVLEPAALAERIAEEARAMAGLYDAGSKTESEDG
jgi:predicted DNA-binding transcriptional regulator YafY